MYSSQFLSFTIKLCPSLRGCSNRLFHRCLEFTRDIFKIKTQQQQGAKDRLEMSKFAIVSFSENCWCDHSKGRTTAFPSQEGYFNFLINDVSFCFDRFVSFCLLSQTYQSLSYPVCENILIKINVQFCFSCCLQVCLIQICSLLNLTF